MKGSFISFEGGEGAGKTTIMNLLSKYLLDRNFPVMVTREPGGIKIAESIRSVILDKSHTEMDVRTEALLYAAARRQHLVEKIIPALHSGKLVLCDRFIDSSLAYQGYARGIGIEEILSINQFATENVLPDITIYFDVDPEIGLSRLKRDPGREINRLDLEKLEFHQQVRAGYHQLLHRFPNRIMTIDANQELEQVFEDTKARVDQLLRMGE